MAIILNVLEGDVVFTNHAIGGQIGNTEQKIAGNVQGEAMRSVPDYHGSYEVTPNATTQVLSVSNKRMTQDLIINPNCIMDR